MGSTAQLAVPIRERVIYTIFWTVVLSVKLAFGHYLLVTPLREAIMALQHPDLCWNKESDEYTSYQPRGRRVDERASIHTQGDVLRRWKRRIMTTRNWRIAHYEPRATGS